MNFFKSSRFPKAEPLAGFLRAEPLNLQFFKCLNALRIKANYTPKAEYGFGDFCIPCLRVSPLKILTRALPSTRKPLKRLDLNFMVFLRLSLSYFFGEYLFQKFSYSSVAAFTSAYNIHRAYNAFHSIARTSRTAAFLHTFKVVVVISYVCRL